MPIPVIILSAIASVYMIGILIAVAMMPIVFTAENPFEGIASLCGDIALYGISIALFATIVGGAYATVLLFYKT